MPKVSNKPYMRSDSSFFSTKGIKLVPFTEEFEASAKGSDEKVTLVASGNKVSFDENLAVAIAAFGSEKALLAELESSVNDSLLVQAKNAAKAQGLVFEQQLADSVNKAIANFIAARNVQPTDEQKKKIRAKIRENLLKIEEQKKLAADVSDIE